MLNQKNSLETFYYQVKGSKNSLKAEGKQKIEQWIVQLQWIKLIINPKTI